MLSINQENVIQSIEEFYCKRMTQLVDQDRIQDSNALFEEFVIHSQEPTEWVFMNVY